MADLIDNPVINSPFAEPQRHFRFTDDGITDEIGPGRRRRATDQGMGSIRSLLADRGAMNRLTKVLYFDTAATTPVASEVLARMVESLQ